MPTTSSSWPRSGARRGRPNVTRMLTEVTDRLVKASDRPDQTYAVTLLDSPVVNAFALPNGRLYVTRGLVALASDTSEVAAVLAHEMAHVTLNHATARSELELRSALVSRVVADVLNDPDTGAQLQHQSRFALARFSREQELEADATGVRTLAKAGYDPFAAGRFLTALNRSTGLKAGSGRPSPTCWRPIRARPSASPRSPGRPGASARRASAPTTAPRYLAAVDGLAYGDNPRDGAVRGHRFIHPGLGIAFEVPEGFTLENTRSAVLGTTPDGSRRLLFDQIEAKDGQPLDAVLKASWNDAFDPAGFETREVGGHPAAFALSRGKDWTFRLAAIRIGEIDLPDDHGRQGRDRSRSRLPPLDREPRRRVARRGGPAPPAAAGGAGGFDQRRGPRPPHGGAGPGARPVPRAQRPGAGRRRWSRAAATRSWRNSRLAWRRLVPSAPRRSCRRRSGRAP